MDSMNLTRPPNRGIGRFPANHIDIRILAAPKGETVVELLAPFEYVMPTGERGVVAPGLLYDGASLPDATWAILGHPLAWCNIFGLPHDEWYRTGLVTHPDGTTRPIDRAEADLLASDFAIGGGHLELRANEIYSALRLFGQPAWDANAAKRKFCGADLARLRRWCSSEERR